MAGYIISILGILHQFNIDFVPISMAKYTLVCKFQELICNRTMYANFTVLYRVCEAYYP